MALTRLFARKEGKATLLYGPGGLIQGVITRETDGYSYMIGREAGRAVKLDSIHQAMKSWGFILI